MKKTILSLLILIIIVTGCTSNKMMTDEEYETLVTEYTIEKTSDQASLTEFIEQTSVRELTNKEKEELNDLVSNVIERSEAILALEGVPEKYATSHEYWKKSEEYTIKSMEIMPKAVIEGDVDLLNEYLDNMTNEITYLDLAIEERNKVR